MKAISSNCELKQEETQAKWSERMKEKLNIHLQVLWFKFASDVT
jgi:hypothetical protein